MNYPVDASSSHARGQKLQDCQRPQSLWIEIELLAVWCGQKGGLYGEVLGNGAAHQANECSHSAMDFSEGFRGQ